MSYEPCQFYKKDMDKDKLKFHKENNIRLCEARKKDADNCRYNRILKRGKKGNCLGYYFSE